MPPQVAKAKAKRGVLKAKAGSVVKTKAPPIPGRKGGAAPKLGVPVGSLPPTQMKRFLAALPGLTNLPVRGPPSAPPPKAKGRGKGRPTSGRNLDQLAEQALGPLIPYAALGQAPDDLDRFHHELQPGRSFTFCMVPQRGGLAPPPSPKQAALGFSPGPLPETPGRPCLADGPPGCGPPEGAWVSGPSIPSWVDSLAWCTQERVLEITTQDVNGNFDGFALFQPLTHSVGDATGITLEVRFHGASQLLRGLELGRTFPDPRTIIHKDGKASIASRGLLHICKVPRAQCTHYFGCRTVHHAETYRVRDPQNVTEPWAFVLGPEVITAPAGPQGPIYDPRPPPREAKGEPSVEELMIKFEELRRKLQDRLTLQGRLCAVAKMKSEKADAGVHFLGEAPLSVSNSAIRYLAHSEPGRRCESGLQEVTQFTGQERGASRTAGAARLMLPYVHTFFQGKFPVKGGSVRDSIDLRFLAECIDTLRAGEPPQLGDILMQRFKQIQNRMVTLDWGEGYHWDVVAKAPLEFKASAASRKRLSEYKVEEMRKSFSVSKAKRVKSWGRH